MKDLTQEQKKEVLELAKRGELRTKIAKTLGIDYRKIKKFLDSENIPIKKQGIPYEFYDPIFELYSSGLNSRQIHEQYYPQFTEDQIGYIVKGKGISRPNGKVAHLNHDYFSNIDSNDKAYWLGLLFADGCVQHHEEKGNCWTVSLDLKVDEKYLVEEFRNAVESDLEVKTYTNAWGFQRKDGKPHTQAKISLFSSKMASDLSKYGIIPRKSLKVKELPDIKEKFMSHFIRGFFDGNGSITYQSKPVFQPRVIFYSTYEFCDSLNEYLHTHITTSKNKVTKQKNANVSLITYGKFDDVVSIYNYLYRDAKIFMKYKKEKFEEYISKYRDNHVA